MKKRTIITAMIFFVTFSAYSQQSITIPVNNYFRLNPILGIRGDAGDADSRFVQRIIFSPLVVPLTDPVIDYNFEYDISVSMISEIFSLRGTSTWRRVYDLNMPDDYMPVNSFKVVLRRNLSFMRGQGKSGNDVTSEDVVFSYRTAQTTLSVRRGKDGEYDTYTNAILRAQLADLESVSYESDYEVVFRFKTGRTEKSFIRFLVFTPILSAKQLTGRADKLRERGAYVFGRDRSELYDMLEMAGREHFERQPESYGQYSVERVRPHTQQIPWSVEEARLVKNSYWAVNGTPRVLEAQGMGRHAEYANGRESFIIKKDSGNLGKIFSEPWFFMNHAMTSDEYNRNRTRISANIDSFNMEKMYISYRLYGLFFSPETSMFNDPDIRMFFLNCANREMMVQSIQTDVNSLSVPAKIRENLLSKISTYPMYYPFFSGISGESNQVREFTNEPQNLEELNMYCRNTDFSYSTYKDLGSDIADYEKLTSEKQGIIRGYFRGELWPAYLENLTKEFETLQRERQIEAKMKGPDGKIVIRILYDNEDPVSRTLFGLYSRNLSRIFEHLEETGKLRTRVSIRGEPLNKRDISNLQAQYDIIIYGWNYRFDFLSELGPVMAKDDRFWRLISLYDDYLKHIQNNAVSEAMMYTLAKYILDNQMMTTMIGVQNYVLFDNKQITMPSLQLLGRHLIMFPYYWRRTSEIR